jgi:hypothetical protein
MLAANELNEYLDEIRHQVCSRCVERPPGGPPCAPLGKACGVEMHLPQLIEAIHLVHSNSLVPYLETNREHVCQHCSFLHSSICPCPMDYLAALVVEAVETVDERRRAAGLERPGQVEPVPGGVEAVRRAFREAEGRWVGCDWHTAFGPNRLDLVGLTAAEAEAMAVLLDRERAPEATCWHAAAGWLARVEEHARLAQKCASAAVAAAEAGDWQQSMENARRAVRLELQPGRPLRFGAEMTWQPLLRAVAEASCCPAGA